MPSAFTAVPAGGVGALISISSTDMGQIALWVSRMPVILVLLVIILIFGGSLLLSIKIYEKRDL